MQTINTEQNKYYILTAATVPVTVSATLDNGSTVTLLTANKTGQFGFASVSSQVKVSQDDAIVTPARGFNNALSGTSSGGGMTWGDGLAVSGDTVSVNWDSLPSDVFRTGRTNIVTGLTSYTQPVNVGNAAGDGHALNLKTYRQKRAFDAREWPLGVLYSDADKIVSLAKTTALKKAETTNARIAAQFTKQYNEAYHVYSLLLPLGNLDTSGTDKEYLALPIISIGTITGTYINRGARPALGECLCTGHLFARSAQFVPGWNCPDGQHRVHTHGWESAETGTFFMGMCILPASTKALLFVKVPYATNPYNLEALGLACLFAIDGKGKCTHLLNQTVFKQADKQLHAYLDGLGFTLGQCSSDVYPSSAMVGLPDTAKLYFAPVEDIDSGIPFGLTEADYKIKQSYVFEETVHQVGADGGTVTDVWRVPGGITLSTAYPASNWLSAAINGNNVTITVTENTTGAARQGVVNFLAGINGITYTILINQSA